MGSGVLIALDWGTTHVRAALLGADGQALEERNGESGVGHFTAAEFEARFDELTEGWPNVPAVACGMVGSRQGWHEAKYLECPASTDELAGALSSFKVGERLVTIVPGLTVRHKASGHDVMRGEEAQLAGLIAREPDFSGTVVLPGTHSKWARLDSGRIVDFQTYMTGEIYSALSKHTILSHSIDDSGAPLDDTAFRVAFGDVFFTNGSDWSRFFGIRAGQLIVGEGLGEGAAKLSGTLIGAEFAAAVKDGFDDLSLTIIASGELGRLYAAGAQVLAWEVTVYKGTDLVWPALFSIAQAANLMELNL
ncbi:2-dehydro-3-deoxygalactonokinase [Pseudahrensia aquimaris]|uniref:2-dehydro-3-deoxygalactonokinase n=1 Tax=Pseudahrensia aquimaris TaxID=744461 RepID=A0ABW3F981_9HYPH